MVQWLWDNVLQSAVGQFVDPLLDATGLRKTAFFRGTVRLMQVDPIRDVLFQRAALAIVVMPLLWNGLARLEYRTGWLTRLVGRGDKYLACYAVAALIFGGSLCRDHLFAEACRADSGLWNALPPAVGQACITGGLALVLASYARLGIAGTYLGDYFGILMSAPVTSFPYSLFKHPMYDGATLAFFGTAVALQSVNGFWLTAVADAMYMVAKRLEG